MGYDSGGSCPTHSPTYSMRHGTVTIGR
jgi:hypothetical protein